MGILLRIAILALAIWLLIRFVRKFINRPEKQDPALDKTQPMKACAECGTFAPQDKMLIHNNRYYCCKDHLPSD